MNFGSQSMKGKFLVATPILKDPNFSECVVFLCEHDAKGAFGIVINKKSSLKAETHFKDHEHHESIRHLDLFLGGPVHTNHILILCRSHNVIANERRIINDMVLLSSLPDLDTFDLFSEDNQDNLRLYLGCSGWSENQLESEISDGAWKILPYKEEMIFSNSPEVVWKDNLARLGGNYTILSNMPIEDDLYKN